MQQELIELGLTPLQAQTYLFLLGRNQGAKPTLLAQKLNITRTNCYKVLDQLNELDLVRRRETDKTFTYYAEDPIALSSLAGRARAHANDLEKRVQSSVKILRNKYQQVHEPTNVESSNGRSAIIHAMNAQVKIQRPIYFVKSQADLSFMGFDTMRALRNAPKQFGTPRFGITPDTPESPADPAIDKRSNLTRTWIQAGKYRAPVEWSVSGDELAILIYEGNGKAIRIVDAVVADAFRQLWKLLDESVRCQPGYGDLPKRANRHL